MDVESSPAGDNFIVKIPQKRPRPILSCLECRKKKLRCSRTTPCVQCTKSRHASRCSYHEYPHRYISSEAVPEVPYSEENGRPRKSIRHEILAQQTRSGSPSPSPNNIRTSHEKPGILENLQRRVEKLECQLSSHAPTLNSIRDTDADESNRTKRYNVSSRDVIRSRGSATHYHGQNQKVALLNHFEEARAFIKRLGTGPENASITGIRNDLASLRKSLSFQPKQRDIEQFRDSTAILQRMLQLLPSQSACNKLVTIYMNNFENELRVLHKPSFFVAVDRFWQSQLVDPLQLSDFIPQILAVLAIASSLDNSALLEEESSRGHGVASMYCDLIAIWLESLIGKQRLKFITLQTQTLLLIAKKAAVEGVKDMWSSTGSLVRLAMTIGLHRDPSESPQIPIFWAESRRRLWFTIVEMDLQISLTCGMPTMVCATDFTCCLPVNVNDTDLAVEMNHPPSPRSFTEWTDSLPQNFLAKSLRQRLTAARLLSNIQDGLDYNEIVEHAKDLERNLQELPPPLKFDHSFDEDSQKPGRLMTRVLIDVHVRRSILSLYGPFAQAELGETDFAEARKGFIQSALVIVCYQDIFDPEFADLDIMTSPRYWDMFHIRCKNDMMHASLGICLEINRWSNKPRLLESSTPAAASGRRSPQTPFVSEQPDPVFTTWTKSSLTKSVEDNIDPLIRRIGRFGSDPNDLLCLTIVLNSVRTSQSAEAKELLMESGIRDVISACQQHLRKTKRSGIQNTTLDISGSALTPLTQTENHNAAVSPKFVSCLTHPDFDFGEMDFGFAQDWQLDQIWH